MLEETLKRLRALIFIRALVVTLLLGSFYVFRIQNGDFLYPEAFSYLIVALYLLTILYAVALRWVKNLVLFAYVQISGDIIAEMALIYITGGIESWFSFTLLLSIISASIILHKRASYYIATLSSVLYGTLGTLQLYKLLPVNADTLFTGRDYIYNIFTHITAFYLVAFLSGYLSERLHKTTQRLREKDMDISDLKAFSRYII